MNLFSGRPAEPPRGDFITRNAMDAEEVTVGWWAGDGRYARPAFFAYAHPPREGFAGASLSPASARWDGELGLYLLDWDDARDGAGLAFARSVFRHACATCDWDSALAATAEGVPPPVS